MTQFACNWLKEYMALEYQLRLAAEVVKNREADSSMCGSDILPADFRKRLIVLGHSFVLCSHELLQSQ